MVGQSLFYVKRAEGVPRRIRVALLATESTQIPLSKSEQRLTERRCLQRPLSIRPAFITGTFCCPRPRFQGASQHAQLGSCSNRCKSWSYFKTWHCNSHLRSRCRHARRIRRSVHRRVLLKEGLSDLVICSRKDAPMGLDPPKKKVVDQTS